MRATSTRWVGDCWWQWTLLEQAHLASTPQPKTMPLNQAPCPPPHMPILVDASGQVGCLPQGPSPHQDSKIKQEAKDVAPRAIKHPNQDESTWPIHWLLCQVAPLGCHHGVGDEAPCGGQVPGLPRGQGQQAKHHQQGGCKLVWLGVTNLHGVPTTSTAHLPCPPSLPPQIANNLAMVVPFVTHTSCPKSTTWSQATINQVDAWYANLQAKTNASLWRCALDAHHHWAHTCHVQCGWLCMCVLDNTCIGHILACLCPHCSPCPTHACTPASL